MDILREVAQQVKQQLAPGKAQPTPEQKAEDVAAFAKDMAPAPEPAGPPDASSEQLQAGSKEGTLDKVEGLSQDASDKVGPVSHEIRVPSHEAFTAATVGGTGPSAATNLGNIDEAGAGAAAGSGDQSSKQEGAGGGDVSTTSEGAAPVSGDTGAGTGGIEDVAAAGVPTSARQTFEERTYQMTKGAETPDGSLEKLQLHHEQGGEYEGSALAGKSEPFNAPAHGAYASSSDQDRPVKLTMGHDYKHETKDQQTETTPEAGSETTMPTTTETKPAVDESHMSLEGGGDITKEVSQPGTEKPMAETMAESGLESASGVEASRMGMEAGAEMQQTGGAEKTEVPQMLQDVAGASGGEEVEGGPKTSATAGQATHTAAKQDFESQTNADAKGAETPDGPVESLHLHAEHGMEGPGSKADKQLEQIMQEGAPQPPSGAGAPDSVQDPPDKMMPHRKEESGVAGRAGATDLTNLTGGQEDGQQGEEQQKDTWSTATASPSTTTPPSAMDVSNVEATGMEVSGQEGNPMSQEVEGGEGSSSLAGMVPHQKDFETETNMEAKGAETPDGALESLHLHAEQGMEGPGSKADKQLEQILQEGAPQPPSGAGATTSQQDPPDKMGWHHKEEAGMSGCGKPAEEPAMESVSASEGTTTPENTPAAGSSADITQPTTKGEKGDVEVEGGQVLKPEAIEKLAEVLADVTGAGSPAATLLHGEEKSEAVQKGEKMREEGHKDPYVPQPGEEVEQADVDAASAGPTAVGMKAQDIPAEGLGPQTTSAGAGDTSSKAHEATTGETAAVPEAKQGADRPTSASEGSSGIGTKEQGIGGGYFSPGKGGSATTEAAHAGYIGDPNAALPAHKTHVPMEVKRVGEEGVEPAGPGEVPHTTTGGAVFDLGTIKDAQVDNDVAVKDFPENIAS